jgi:hypothetical protein
MFKAILALAAAQINAIATYDCSVLCTELECLERSTGPRYGFREWEKCGLKKKEGRYMCTAGIDRGACIIWNWPLNGPRCQGCCDVSKCKSNQATPAESHIELSPEQLRIYTGTVHLRGSASNSAAKEFSTVSGTAANSTQSSSETVLQ